MNIDDVKSMNDFHGDRLEAIFEKQLELLKKYDQIELANGLRVTTACPVSLHDRRGQYVLKDYAWRITEELGEALEAFQIHKDTPQHCDEELSDALHFLTEFTILAGVKPASLLYNPIGEGQRFDMLRHIFAESRSDMIGFSQRFSIALNYRTGRFVESLAKTCNTLKNKPWKQTQMMTDVDYFNKNLVEAWHRFIQLCITAQISPEYLFDLYFRKSEVNKFRQRSNY